MIVKCCFHVKGLETIYPEREQSRRNPKLTERATKEIGGLRPTGRLSRWPWMCGWEYSFTAFTAFLTKYFSLRHLTLWNQTSWTGDSEGTHPCGLSLCMVLAVLLSNNFIWCGKTRRIFSCLYEASCTCYGCIFGSSAVACFWDILMLVHGITAVASGICLG